MKRAAFYVDRAREYADHMPCDWLVLERVSKDVIKPVAKCKSRAEAREAARALNLEEKRNAP